MDRNELTERIIGTAIRVHRTLGPGLLESTYEHCFAAELSASDLPFERQALLPVEYRGVRIEQAYRVDFIIAGQVIVELKSVASIEAVHIARVLTYLKLTGCNLGLLINFNVPLLQLGIRRLIL